MNYNIDIIAVSSVSDYIFHGQDHCTNIFTAVRSQDIAFPKAKAWYFYYGIFASSAM